MLDKAKLEKAENLAKKLMAKYGLKNWKFRFTKARREYGLCVYRKKTLALSMFLVSLNELSETKDVILHEIAHALTEDEKEKHGEKWLKVYRSIGGSGKAEHDCKVVPPSRVATCPTCNHRILRYRRDKTYCTSCMEKYGIKIYFDWQIIEA